MALLRVHDGLGIARKLLGSIKKSSRPTAYCTSI